MLWEGLNVHIEPLLDLRSRQHNGGQWTQSTTSPPPPPPPPHTHTKKNTSLQVGAVNSWYLKYMVSNQ